MTLYESIDVAKIQAKAMQDLAGVAAIKIERMQILEARQILVMVRKKLDQTEEALKPVSNLGTTIANSAKRKRL